MFKLKLEALLGALGFGLAAWFVSASDDVLRLVPKLPYPREMLTAAAALLGFFAFNFIRVSRVVNEGGRDERRAALRREPEPGEALVYFVRGGGVAANGTMELVVDLRTVGFLQGSQFMCFGVRAGERKFQAIFGGRAATQIPVSDYVLNAAAGEKIVLAHKIKFGWVRPKISWERRRFDSALPELERTSFVRARAPSAHSP